MNKRRLLKLAGILENNAKNDTGAKFDLGGWGSFPAGKPAKLDCGTTACAVGLACISGAFKDQGLTYETKIFPWNGKLIPTPCFQGERGWVAVTKFWGLSIEQAQRLFMDTSYPPDKRTGAVAERAVAYRIRRLVARSASATQR